MIKLGKILSESPDPRDREIEDQVEDLEGKEAIMQYLVSQGKEPELIQLGKEEYVIWDDNITDVEYPRIYEKQEWLWDHSSWRIRETLQDMIEERFNKSFWMHPEPLFHGTPEDNVESISLFGIRMQHKSRGLSNRGITSAVFTEKSPEFCGYHYGPAVFEINTPQMKADGFMPVVTKEPNHIESDVVNFLAHKIGTVGPSELRLICAAVYSDSIAKEDYTFWRNSDAETTASGQVVTDKTPFLSLRNQATNLLGSGTNRVSIYPETLALYVADNPVKIEVYHDAELTGSSGWITSSLSTIAYDNTATTMSLGAGGFKFITFYAPVGVTNVDLRQYYELNDEALCLRADGDFRTYTYTATPLAGSSARVTATMTYRELS